MLYKYKYNGKEWQDEVGLNMYAMDMRQYDPAIARWVAQDPVVHHDVSPYSAFDNNPVLHADPSGADTNTMMGGDLFGNDRYNKYGGYVPQFERPSNLVQSAMESDIDQSGYDEGGSFQGEGTYGEIQNIDKDDIVSTKSLIYQLLKEIGVKDPNSSAPVDYASIEKIINAPEFQSYIKGANFKLKIDLVIAVGSKTTEKHALTGGDGFTNLYPLTAFTTWARLALTITHEAVHRTDLNTKKWNGRDGISKWKSEVRAWKRSSSLGDTTAKDFINLYQSWIDLQTQH